MGMLRLELHTRCGMKHFKHRLEALCRSDERFTDFEVKAKAEDGESGALGKVKCDVWQSREYLSTLGPS